MKGRKEGVYKDNRTVNNLNKMKLKANKWKT